LNSRFGFDDVIGGNDGTGIGVSLDSSSPMDFSNIESKLSSKLSGAYEDKSYRFQGSASSYVQIPSIPMANDFTIVSFIKPEKDGPIFQWDPSGVWGDHFWVVRSGSGYSLFFRPMGLSNQWGTPIIIGE